MRLVGQSGRPVIRNTFLSPLVRLRVQIIADVRGLIGSGQMTEAVTIDNDELAMLCDIVSGWGVKKSTENAGAAKKQALSRLIAQGYVEPAQEPSAIRYQHTAEN